LRAWSGSGEAGFGGHRIPLVEAGEPRHLALHHGGVLVGAQHGAVDARPSLNFGRCRLMRVMLRMQLPLVWMPCMFMLASGSIKSALRCSGIQLYCRLCRVVKWA
jgi:hypothetical protein